MSVKLDVMVTLLLVCVALAKSVEAGMPAGVAVSVLAVSFVVLPFVVSAAIFPMAVASMNPSNLIWKF